MTVLHATQPASVYLSYWARSRSPETAQLDRALYTERSLIKQLAMRRTLFVFPRDLLPATWGSASARIARTERNRIARQIVNSGLAVDGERGLERLRVQVLSQLAEYPEGLSALELRKLVPKMSVKLNTTASARDWFPKYWPASARAATLCAPPTEATGVLRNHGGR